MTTSSVEITDKEYLIRLCRNDFDLGFINCLIKRIQAERQFFRFESISSYEEDIISRRVNNEVNEFDKLEDK
ncbi:hypothetical protein FW774_07375 [Pedobacter sp. BS3]|uniref:hypothetical protein n=1 Tax=Pedobacter sp. BS3 TaxID=2567937 RepID=UPI0011EED611|nr:hypothetical protein [Pedobacter sp. BS3]TZF84791.1 hypothetical protein FW774_07375 [Pedobacter sp. BS3]